MKLNWREGFSVFTRHFNERDHYQLVKFRHYTITRIPAQSAYAIYLIRYRLYRDTEQKKIIHGYPDLLAKLKVAGNGHVAIHSFTGEQDFLLVFTEEENGKCYGAISNLSLSARENVPE